VVVGPTFTGRSARDIGLLAHELTHVARAREPRFVPPIARPTPARGIGFQGEEDVARRVEARVSRVANGRSHARAAVETAEPPFPGFPHAVVPPELPTFDSSPDAGGDDPRMLPEQTGDDEWGGLPAPWEPLPEWLAPAPSASPETPAVGLVANQARSLTAPAARVASPVSAPPPTAVAVHRADESRMVDAAAPAPAPGAPGAPGEEAAEGPDIDWLARQVYSALKRRLGAEARRENLF
jgi:hypothetical protein